MPPQQQQHQDASASDPVIQEAYNFMSGGAGGGGGGAMHPPPSLDYEPSPHPSMTYDPSYHPPSLPQQPSPPLQYEQYDAAPRGGPIEKAMDFLADLAPSLSEVQLIVAVMAAFVLINSTSFDDILARFAPAMFDRVPHSDAVIKALLIGAAVFVAVRMVTQVARA